MSDLISRKSVIEKLEKIFEQNLTLGETNLVSDIVAYIMIEPTAYDIDKVVKELMNHKDTTDLTTVDEEMVEGFTVYKGAFNDAIEEAIEIVKQGGVADDVCEWESASDGEFIQNPHTKRLYSDEPSMKNIYCNTCGKKIKVVE